MVSPDSGWCPPIPPIPGGTDDVMRLVDVLERADVVWCAIGGVAVNHWAEQPMVTRDVDVVVAADAVERAVSLLEAAGFRAERFPWSDPERRQHKRIKDLADIARLVEAHPDLWRELPAPLKELVQRPDGLA